MEFSIKITQTGQYDFAPELLNATQNPVFNDGIAGKINNIEFVPIEGSTASVYYPRTICSYIQQGTGSINYDCHTVVEGGTVIYIFPYVAESQPSEQWMEYVVIYAEPSEPTVWKTVMYS